jgi:CHASE3 domain sensor protein
MKKHSITIILGVLVIILGITTYLQHQELTNLKQSLINVAQVVNVHNEALKAIVNQ